MKRRLAVAGAVVVAAAAVISVAEALESGSALAVAYVTGTATSTPEVWVANGDGSGAHLLGPGAQPLIAPNGAFVAASRPLGLVLYPAVGGVARRYFMSAAATAVAVAFSPDSRYLAVVLSSRDPASAAGSGLAVVDTSTFIARIIVRGQIYGASFAPDGSDRIAYAAAPSAALTAAVDIHVIGSSGSAALQLTHDGRSLNPVWGRSGVAFDHERLRRNAEPAYQLWLIASDGSGVRPLTSLAIPPLREGLVPISFSGDGRRLLAEYEGQDTSGAWLLSLSGGRAFPVGTDVTGWGLSRDGSSVLVDRGGSTRPDLGVVESLPAGVWTLPRPWAAHGSEPSWDGGLTRRTYSRCLVPTCCSSSLTPVWPLGAPASHRRAGRGWAAWSGGGGKTPVRPISARGDTGSWSWLLTRVPSTLPASMTRSSRAGSIGPEA